MTGTFLFILSSLCAYSNNRKDKRRHLQGRGIRVSCGVWKVRGGERFGRVGKPCLTGKGGMEGLGWVVVWKS